MKNTRKHLGTFILFLAMTATVFAQINRTLETKVADILAQLPTKDFAYADKLMQDIVTLDSPGILQFTQMLVPLGTGDDTKVRYALDNLARYAGHQQGTTQRTVETTLLKAIQMATNKEVKTFLIRRLVFCGTNRSISELSSYLPQKAFYQPALQVLESLHTEQAAQAVLKATQGADDAMKPSLIKTLGNLKYLPAQDYLMKQGQSSNTTVQQYALGALAQIGSEKAMDYLISAAKKSNYKRDASQSILALINYANQLTQAGNSQGSSKIAALLLKNCTTPSQFHFRAAALELFPEAQRTKVLLREIHTGDKAYKGKVLELAAKNLTPNHIASWHKIYKKAPESTQVMLINALGKTNSEDVLKSYLIPALESPSQPLKLAAIKALAYQDKNKTLPILLKTLGKQISVTERNALKVSLLRLIDAKDIPQVLKTLPKVDSKGKQVLVELLGDRHAKGQFSTVSKLLPNADNALKQTIYKTLPVLASKADIPMLVNALSQTKDPEAINDLRSGLITVLKKTKDFDETPIYNAYQKAKNKATWLPLLSTLGSKEALKFITAQWQTGDSDTKKRALTALSNWKNNDAIPVLFEAVKTATLQSEAFTAYLKKVKRAQVPADQKLLLIRRLTPYAKKVSQKKQLIKSASGVKTFLSLIFVSEFMTDPALLETASNTAIRIALPTPGKEDALSGDVVRKIVSQSINNLTGQDSQYLKIDVKEFLDKMPKTPGFLSIFNGKDLSGWKGLVKNPIERAKMSETELKKAQQEANKKMNQDWFVKDGIIQFRGKGYDNICTTRDYGDFEMLVDWKITHGGDSGIYLRGTPQVQIWDTALTKVGAQVGSGGLYNNKKHRSTPLVVADNPVDSWNTFRIKMVGDRVTVHLNGVLVTDNVPLENYWDRSQSIFPKEAIELQAHGENLGFRNLYVREISSETDQLSKDEKAQGFKSLFNGKNLDYWIGNKKDYLVENGELVVRPKQGGHGNLFTSEEYSDFVFRFEFKLTPGANNGLGIHAPLKGDVAYVGKELQILDNTAAIYKNLKPYQYHGSVYGIIPAKRGFLNPVGTWNTEEVIVKGDDIKITLNGTVILEGNIAEASKNGTADHKNHPGLKRHSGHIGFLGHGSMLWFRNIRIKDLSKNK